MIHESQPGAPSKREREDDCARKRGDRGDDPQRRRDRVEPVVRGGIAAERRGVALDVVGELTDGAAHSLTRCFLREPDLDTGGDPDPVSVAGDERGAEMKETVPPGKIRRSARQSHRHDLHLRPVRGAGIATVVGDLDPPRGHRLQGDGLSQGDPEFGREILTDDHFVRTARVQGPTRGNHGRVHVGARGEWSPGVQVVVGEVVRPFGPHGQARFGSRALDARDAVHRAHCVQCAIGVGKVRGHVRGVRRDTQPLKRGLGTRRGRERRHDGGNRDCRNTSQHHQ